MKGAGLSFRCGIYARMRFFFLKHRQPEKLAKMEKSGILRQHLDFVDFCAETMIRHYAAKHKNQMENVSLKDLKIMREELETSIINTLIIEEIDEI